MPRLTGLLARLPWRARSVRHAAVLEGVLGTTLDLQVVAGTSGQARAAQAALLAEIDRLEGVFSRFRPDSELNRWLATSGGQVPVSADLGGVLREALHWTERSGGAFHPATEALSPLWRAAEQSGVPPAQDALDVVLRQMRGPLYRVQEEGGAWTATHLTPLPLGFNAFAKGHIADRAALAALGVPGVTQVLVNLGGDLRVLGPQPVTVDIADPSTLADNAAPLCRVRVQDAGVATSGRARRGFRVGGTWYSHLLDPRSGQPLARVVSASVTAPSSAVADVLATVLSVLPPADGLAFVRDVPGCACLLVEADGTVHRSARWPALEV
ncbi:FAD:protein FMN transferase [Deinococcus aquiradiocola]|uniref:FAD:protein FMN transferase n=1 Tax=Deinococcus aquiradiocola TaxID=393059 RepID=A0A917UTV8_9DEIO|nr:FAD:protein FMN transferase [Deinococcus aquiradiocola]GGJ84787.1 FAD:protein FMN transferase [Deinococcus aquiradiocola]